MMMSERLLDRAKEQPVEAGDGRRVAVSRSVRDLGLVLAAKCSPGGVAALLVDIAVEGDDPLPELSWARTYVVLVATAR